MSAPGYFITGTDTGVGKTMVTAALLLAARARGRRALGLKPLAAGATRTPDGWMNEDAALLRQCAEPGLDYAEVNPVLLSAPMAPHIAARREGRTLSAADLHARVAQTVNRRHPDLVLVEGAGGWLVPLNDRETMADLATALAYPVILVVAMRLGCLNHALLTARAVAAAGLSLAGWVANSTGAPMDALDENLATLDDLLPALRLGVVPDLGSDALPARVNHWLDVTGLRGF